MDLRGLVSAASAMQCFGPTMDLECFPRLSLDPFAIDVCDILLEEGRVIELAAKINRLEVD